VQSEAAGAATTTQDQATVQKIQTALKSDTTLSGASNIQVTMENGKIVVRGTVNSEAEKKAIEQKIKDYTFENQIQVQGEEGQQPDPSSSEDDADDDAGSK